MIRSLLVGASEGRDLSCYGTFTMAMSARQAVCSAVDAEGRNSSANNLLRRRRPPKAPKPAIPAMPRLTFADPRSAGNEKAPRQSRRRNRVLADPAQADANVAPITVGHTGTIPQGQPPIGAGPIASRASSQIPPGEGKHADAHSAGRCCHRKR